MKILPRPGDEVNSGTADRIRRRIAVACVLAVICLSTAGGILVARGEYKNAAGNTEPGSNAKNEYTPEERENVVRLSVAYTASYGEMIPILNDDNEKIAELPRGKAILLSPLDENEKKPGKVKVQLEDGTFGYTYSDSVVDDRMDAVFEDTFYVRTSINLSDITGTVPGTLVEKGSKLEVTGFDYIQEDGSVHMYLVSNGSAEGYIRPWYLADNQKDAKLNYDKDGSLMLHVGRGDSYGGGNAAGLDYYPREKFSSDENVMPEECRALYLNSDPAVFDMIDDYIEIADSSGINAFVIDITDGTAIGYKSPVMQHYCPSAYENTDRTLAEYKAVVDRVKEAGYYVIGRITAFNDTFFASDNPDCAIKQDGDLLVASGSYWPSAYSRYAWEYKIKLAVEAAEEIGFNEIQFDYVRFPDRTGEYEDTIDFGNVYNETKAQAIQRFLMFASDKLHDVGVYLGADVFGESAFTYVTAYGQYWPAISNVVDVISGMPYPDHFSANGDYYPWTHPYETLYNWGVSVATRQSETASPAVVRTWIQTYDAIRWPYNTYGPDEIKAEIKGLRDAGLTGGFMTWNGVSNISKYDSVKSAFEPAQ